MTEHHEVIVGRGLSALPLALREDAQKYIADRLRPIRDVVDSDVRAAVGAALAKYNF